MHGLVERKRGRSMVGEGRRKTRQGFLCHWLSAFHRPAWKPSLSSATVPFRIGWHYPEAGSLDEKAGRSRCRRSFVPMVSTILTVRRKGKTAYRVYLKSRLWLIEGSSSCNVLRSDHSEVKIDEPRFSIVFWLCRTNRIFRSSPPFFIPRTRCEGTKSSRISK